MIQRALRSEIMRLSQYFKVVAVSGPRQSGKTTLCQNLFPDYAFFSLDSPKTLQEVEPDPEEFLLRYGKQGLILDEAQTLPQIFTYLKLVSDAHPDFRFIITGSSNYLLLSNVTESMAGRVGLTTLLPLSLAELGEHANADADTLMFRGGFPAIWGQGIAPQDVADAYYRTYIERDLRQIVNLKNLSLFQIFIRLCAGRIGTEFNPNTISGEIGADVKTIKEWLSLLEASYVVFRLPPFFQNIGKRLVKSPKIYFYDTALVCYLLGIESPEQLRTHPLRGAIFENLVVLEFMKNRLNAGRPSNLFFYRDQSQHEVDIVQEFGWQYRAYEVKSATAYHSDFTKNLSYLKKILGDRLISGQVIYDGKMEQDIPENGHINFRRVGKLSPYPPAEGSALKIC